MASRLGSCIAVAVICLIFYIVFTGSLRLYDIVTGVIVSLTSGAIVGELIVRNSSKFFSPRRILRLLAYTVKYFLVYEVKAHLEVMRIILSPKPRYTPAIVRVPYQSSSEYAIMLAGNSITNTPGTLVVDVDEDKRLFYVHWLNALTLEPREAYRFILEYFDKNAVKIFD